MNAVSDTLYQSRVSMLAYLFATLKTIKELEVGDKFIMIFRLLVPNKKTKGNESIFPRKIQMNRHTYIRMYARTFSYITFYIITHLSTIDTLQEDK